MSLTYRNSVVVKVWSIGGVDMYGMARPHIEGRDGIRLWPTGTDGSAGPMW